MQGEAGKPSAPVIIRSELAHADLLEIERIQAETWGPGDVVPLTQLRATEHTGGHLALASLNGEAVGFSYAYLSAPHGRGMAGYGLHSHMVAVLPKGQGLGVGQALKWEQRRWALAQGFRWITWTFDPLQGRNAKLNLEHLGCVVLDYLEDFYGQLDGPLGGGVSGDRALALWRLQDERVSSRAPRTQGTSRPRSATDDAEGAHPPGGTQRDRERRDSDGDVWLLERSHEGHDAEPTKPPTGQQRIDGAEPWASHGSFARVAVPQDATRLFREDHDLAARWRLAVREALGGLLALGGAAVGFEGGAYVVSPTAEVET